MLNVVIVALFLFLGGRGPRHGPHCQHFKRRVAINSACVSVEPCSPCQVARAWDASMAAVSALRAPEEEDEEQEEEEEDEEEEE